MQYKNTLEALYIHINEVQQNVAVWGSEENIHNIDIDLALSKLRDIYDLMLNLRNENSAEHKVEEISSIHNTTVEKEPESTAETEIELDIVEKPEEDEIENEAVKNVSKKEKAEEIKQHIIEEKSALSEKFSNTRPTLNEELSSQVSSADLANQLKNRPIRNLSSAIGLNEKFEFINTLFHGNKEEYEKTIEKLNMAANFNEAYNFLNAKLQWDMSDPLVQRMLELIRRKLIVKKNE